MHFTKQLKLEQVLPNLFCYTTHMKKLPLSEKLIEKDTYQVLVCSSPANIMVGFAAHTWFLINQKGKLTRREVLHFRKDRALSIGYLHTDYFEPFTGIEIWQHYTKYHWKGTVLDIITGDEHSVAAKMINCIERSSEEYPFTETYSLPGPNSNTYTQWVLTQFPQVTTRLPWNAFGKKFLFKNTKK